MKTKTLVMIRKIALLLILTLSQSLLCHVPVFAETEGSEYVSTNGDTLDHFIINEEGVRKDTENSVIA